MKISKEFSKYAKSYASYNTIQNKVLAHLITKVKHEPKNILDLGCGSGDLCKHIDFKYEKLVGVDFAQGMLELHPKGENIECIYGDFNDDKLFDKLKNYSFDFIFSASALQWADDLDKVFRHLKELDAQIALAIFTSKTFITLNKTAKLEPILKSAELLNALQKKYFNAEFEVVNYKLEFENTREMFRYIKKSGVSASRRVLSYKQTKELMRDYPLNYLEFEVVFISSFSKS